MLMPSFWLHRREKENSYVDLDFSASSSVHCVVYTYTSNDNSARCRKHYLVSEKGDGCATDSYGNLFWSELDVNVSFVILTEKKNSPDLDICADTASRYSSHSPNAAGLHHCPAPQSIFASPAKGGK